MHKMLLTPLIALILGGCALAPGMYAGGLDEGVSIVARDGKTGKGISVTVYPVTVTELNKFALPARQGMPAEDPLPYYLGPGDVVSITVWEHPELTIPQGEFRSAEAAGNQVDEYGFLFYPHCGEIYVVGSSRGKLREQLVACLGKVIRNPQVDVRIIQFRSQRVVVGGAVNRPGVVPITDVPVYAMDAITGAGGFAPNANPRYASVTRAGKAYQLDLKAYTETGDPAQNPLLRSGDTVHVSFAYEQRINLLGEFLRSQTLTLDDSLKTLTDALGAAAGLNPNSAEADRILVMRKLDTGHAVLWFRNANPLELAAAQQFDLQPGDVIYVDQTGLARWNKVISLMLPTALTSLGNTAAVSSKN